MGYEDRSFLARIDWAAIVASVVIGLGVTLLLVVFGAAVGISVADDENAGAVSAAIGGWTVVSALIGAFVGTFAGGRVTRSIDPGSPIFHGLASWSLVTITAVWLGATGVAGLLGAGLQAASRVADETGLPGSGEVPTEAPTGTVDAIAWGGWALAVGFLLTLAVSIIGWWAGERSQPVAHNLRDAEQPIARERVGAATTRR